MLRNAVVSRNTTIINGTVTKIEEALINCRLRVSKVS